MIDTNTKAKKKYVYKKLIQISMGATMLIASAVIIAMACKGNTCEEQDIGATFITIPMGLYLIFTRDAII